MLVTVRKDEETADKERVTLLPSLRVCISCQRTCYGKSRRKKRVMRKRRRSEHVERKKIGTQIAAIGVSKTDESALSPQSLKRLEKSPLRPEKCYTCAKSV